MASLKLVDYAFVPFMQKIISKRRLGGGACSLWIPKGLVYGNVALFVWPFEEQPLGGYSLDPVLSCWMKMITGPEGNLGQSGRSDKFSNYGCSTTLGNVQEPKKAPCEMMISIPDFAAQEFIVN